MPSVEKLTPEAFTVPRLLQSPPAGLFRIEFLMFTVPKFLKPPPVLFKAELPTNVLLIILAVPLSTTMPPPVPFIDELPDRVLLIIVIVPPLLAMAPPLLDELFDVGIGKDGRVIGDAEFAIENGMTEGDAWFEAFIVGGAADADGLS